MRLGIISAAAVLAVLAVLATASVGFAQNEPSSAGPPANRQAAANETFWPTPLQESEIPYHPCTIARAWVDRHLICWNW